MLHIKSIKEGLRKASHHVIIKVEGKNREQFINICLRRKLDIWNVRVNEKFTVMCMTAASFKKNVRQIVKKTGVRVKITGRGGLKHKLLNYRFRVPLAVYGIIGALMILFCSSFVWSVNISGGTENEKEQARKVLKECGISAGSTLIGIDTKEIANKVVIGVDTLKWVNITRVGTVIKVDLLNEETYEDGDGQITGPRDMIAKKDALIIKIVAESGTAVMSENSVVLKGDTIISGLVYPVDEIYGTEPRLVSASGEVTGIVRYTANTPIETEAKLYTASGRTAKSVKLKIFNKSISLPSISSLVSNSKHSQSDFQHYNTVVEEQNFFLDCFHILPVSLVKTDFYETFEQVVHFNEEEALEFAKINAMRILDEKIPDNTKVISTGGEIRDIDGVSCYCVWAECEESIGEYVRLEVD